MRLPNFLIVGAPKCGTTAVYAYLRSHPEVFLPERKEPNFFCSNRYYGLDDPREYYGLFNRAGDAKAVGEGSVHYFGDPESPALVREALGADVRVLIFLRNPVDAIYSMWGQMVQSGLESLSFEEAYNGYEQRFEDPDFNRLFGQWRYLFDYRGYGMYSGPVGRYLDMFGRRNVGIYIFEEFFQAGLPQYPDLCRFLGISDEHRPDSKIINPAGAPRFIWLARLLQQQGPVHRVARKILPESCRTTIMAAMNAFNSVARPLPSLSDDMRARLESDLGADVRRLEKLLELAENALWFSGGASAEPAVAGGSLT